MKMGNEVVRPKWPRKGVGFLGMGQQTPFQPARESLDALFSFPAGRQQMIGLHFKI